MAISINYQSIKDISEALRNEGVSVTTKDLIVLAPQNDPFYAGSPAQRRDAEWFAELYHKVVTSGAVHLRRVHYRILEELPPEERMLPTPLTTKNKKTKETIEFTYYQNYERCWNFLTGAAKAARYLNLVPIDAFVDNRAKEASFSFYARWPREGDWDYTDPTPGYNVVGEWEDKDAPQMPELEYIPSHFGDLPKFSVTGYEMQQPYHIEIWVEKSEGEDIFLPLCSRYRANFVPGVGDMSITTTYRFCERVRRAARPAKLLYVSDFDPSGFNMPIAVARKLEHFVRNYGFDDLDITLEPIMLTADQVDTYSLPPAPVKDSDGRKDEWEAMHGGAVELNAMFSNDQRVAEAKRIIEEAILQYYDADLNRRAREVRRELEIALNGKQGLTLNGPTGAEWDDLQAEYQAIRSEWDGLQADVERLLDPIIPSVEAVQSRIDDLNERAAGVYAKLLGEFGQVDIDAKAEYPLPETLDAPTDEALYHSQRGYFGQLEHYTQYRGNVSGYDVDLYDALVQLDQEGEG